jgi:hypothetical protein
MILRISFAALIFEDGFKIFMFKDQNISLKINFVPLKVMSTNIQDVFSST